MPGKTSRATLYPNHYAWLVFVAAMDVMMTFIVLYRGGYEANVLAEMIIRRFGIVGMVLFKFFIVTFAIALCESVGRRSFIAGKLLARMAIILTSAPVALAFGMLLLGKI